MTVMPSPPAAPTAIKPKVITLTKPTQSAPQKREGRQQPRVIQVKRSTGKESLKNERDEDRVESLTSKLTMLDINIEPYVEQYIMENYFKLHDLIPFQMRGILLSYILLFTHSYTSAIS